MLLHPLSTPLRYRSKYRCHGKTSLSSWQIINYPPPLPKNQKNSSKTTPTIPPSPSPKKTPAALNPPLPFPSHISHIFYSSKHPETPYLQGFKRKTTKKKKRTVFSYNKKNCQKNDSCVNTPYSKTS